MHVSKLNNSLLLKPNPSPRSPSGTSIDRPMQSSNLPQHNYQAPNVNSNNSPNSGVVGQSSSSSPAAVLPPGLSSFYLPSDGYDNSLQQINNNNSQSSTNPPQMSSQQQQQHMFSHQKYNQNQIPMNARQGYPLMPPNNLGQNVTPQYRPPQTNQSFPPVSQNKLQTNQPLIGQMINRDSNSFNPFFNMFQPNPSPFYRPKPTQAPVSVIDLESRLMQQHQQGNMYAENENSSMFQSQPQQQPPQSQVPPSHHYPWNPNPTNEGSFFNPQMFPQQPQQQPMRSQMNPHSIPIDRLFQQLQVSPQESSDRPSAQENFQIEQQMNYQQPQLPPNSLLLQQQQLLPHQQLFQRQQASMGLQDPQDFHQNQPLNNSIEALSNLEREQILIQQLQFQKYQRQQQLLKMQQAQQMAHLQHSNQQQMNNQPLNNQQHPFNNQQQVLHHQQMHQREQGLNQGMYNNAHPNNNQHQPFVGQQNKDDNDDDDDDEKDDNEEEIRGRGRGREELDRSNHSNSYQPIAFHKLELEPSDSDEKKETTIQKGPPPDLLRTGVYITGRAKRILGRLPPLSLQKENRITREVIDLVQSLYPPETTKAQQQDLLERLQKIIASVWPDHSPKLHLFGSSANHFCLLNHDVDLCLTIDQSVGEKTDIIQKFAEVLAQYDMEDINPLIWARVPILKFKDSVTGLNCDVCVNNILALQNTQLLSDYSAIDPRVKTLVLAVKYWAKQRKINEPYKGTLSSYAYVLMVINFLQRTDPPILPCLQQMIDESIAPTIIQGFDCTYFNKIDQLKGFGAKNSDSFGKLLTNFFKFYGFEFDYIHSVICIRTGGFLSKDIKCWLIPRHPRESSFFGLEDPFDITHNLGRVVDRDGFDTIRSEFERGYKILVKTGDVHRLTRLYTLDNPDNRW